MIIIRGRVYNPTSHKKNRVPIKYGTLRIESGSITFRPSQPPQQQSPLPTTCDTWWLGWYLRCLALEISIQRKIYRNVIAIIIIKFMQKLPDLFDTSHVLTFSHQPPRKAAGAPPRIVLRLRGGRPWGDQQRLDRVHPITRGNLWVGRISIQQQFRLSSIQGRNKTARIT